jgi:hypothetical protein
MKTFVLLASLLAVSCGSKAPTKTTPTGGGGGSGSAVATGSGSAAAKPPLPDVPFDSLDHAQRIQFMEEKVLPTMEPLFKAHDPKKFADFGCKTCHGAGVKDDKYDMPNDKLPKLFGPSMPKYEKEDVDFMSKTVKPTMAKLLKQPEMSKDNPKGFGCLECHTAEPK